MAYFSEETNRFIDDVNSESARLIKNLYEISVLTESAISKNRLKEFKDLIFSAKYVKGLKHVLGSRVVNAEDFTQKIFEEFNLNLRKVIDQLRKIISGEDEKIKKHFHEKYFQLDQDCIVNTLDLSEDLALCKEYLNKNPERLTNQI